MRKKITFITLTSLIFIFLIGVILFFEIPRLKYNYNEELDGYFITNVYGNSKSFTIPNSHNEKKVIGIDNKAFDQLSNLEEVIFLEDSNITYINNAAFFECTSLKSISFPNSLKEIAVGAFMGCENLEKVSFNNESKLASIGGNAFFDCTNLKEVYLPINDNLYSIGDYAFLYTNIETLVLNENTKLYKYALDGINEKAIIKK